MVAAEQLSIASPIAAVTAHGNDVRCLYDLWWGIAYAATPYPLATDDCCPKRCPLGEAYKLDWWHSGTTDNGHNLWSQ